MPNSRSASRNRSGGRIHIHERLTDNEAAIIGAGIAIQDSHQSAVRETEDQVMKLETRRNYRNRIQEICTFLKAQYPDYASEGIKELTDEDKSDPTKFHHDNTHDLVYSSMNVEMIKAFLGFKKRKSTGQTTSFSHVRKYKDAILWGAEQAGEFLSSTFYREIEIFLKSYKKETRKAKSEGKLDENEADPIPFSLFRLLMVWAIDRCNIFLWVFSVLQWHFMARSINIGVLGLHNFSLGADSIIGKYDKSKADQMGKKVHDKNLYANPFDPVVCCHLALAVWISIEVSRFETSEMLFQKPTDRDDAASARYCSQLCYIVEKNWEAVKGYLRPDHCNGHGVRKGGATHVTSATTHPPPVSSIAARGEWSLGRILDLYWHFAEPGDHYLGRCLAALDPDSEAFATLPPHFSVDDPMANECIAKSMKLMYSTVLTKWGTALCNPTGLLLRILPSIVHHSDFLQATARRIPGHPFAKIPLLQHPELLQELKAYITTEPKGTVTKATGIPPHIRMVTKIAKVADLCNETLETVGRLSDTIEKAVSDAYKKKQANKGI